MIPAGIAALCITEKHAVATDMDKAVYADNANSAKPAELGSGWYIRGDLGLKRYSEHHVGTPGNRAFGSLSETTYAHRLLYRIDAGYRPSGFPQLRSAPDGLRKRIVASRN